MLLAARAAGSTQKECKGGAGHAAHWPLGACGAGSLWGGSDSSRGRAQWGLQVGGLETPVVSQWWGGGGVKKVVTELGCVPAGTPVLQVLSQVFMAPFQGQGGQPGQAQAAGNHSLQRNGCAENYSQLHTT